MQVNEQLAAADQDVADRARLALVGDAGTRPEQGQADAAGVWGRGRFCRAVGLCRLQIEQAVKFIFHVALSIAEHRPYDRGTVNSNYQEIRGKPAMYHMMKAGISTGRAMAAKVRAVISKVPSWDSHALEALMRSTFQNLSCCFISALYTTRVVNPIPTTLRNVLPIMPAKPRN
jgi:hypothetical protein